jgi:hypothetical protein
VTVQKASLVTVFSACILIELIVMFGLGWITLDSTARVENSPTVWFCTALPIAMFLHLTLARFAEARRIRNTVIRAGVNWVWTTISDVRGFLSFLRSGLLAVLALVAILWLGRGVQRQWARGELEVSIPTYAYAGGHLAYWCVVAPAYYLLRRRFTFGAGFLCTVVGERLVFALGKNTFDVGIDEIIELRVLADYGEGAAFFQRNVSSNLPVIARNPIETTRWLAGKVSRPRVFIQPPSTGQPSVFLRVPEVFVFAPLLARSVEVLKPFGRPSLPEVATS